MKQNDANRSNWEGDNSTKFYTGGGGGGGVQPLALFPTLFDREDSSINYLYLKKGTPFANMRN